MKKIFFITLFSIFAFTTNNFAQGTEMTGPYHIKIQVKGLQDTICWLGNYFGQKTYFADTSHFDHNGVAIFNAKDKPHGVYLFVMPGNKHFEFIFNESDISLVTDTSDYMGHMEVKKSEENKIFFAYSRFVNKKGGAANDISIQIKKLKKDSTDEKRNKKTIEKLEKKGEKIRDEISDYRSKTIKDNPNTLAAAMFRSMEKVDIPDEIPTLENGEPDSTFKYKFYKKHYWKGFDFADQRMLYSPIYANKLLKYFKKVLPQDPKIIITEADSIVKLTQPNHDMFKFTVQKLTNTFERSNIMGMDAAFVHMGQKYYLSGKADWLDSASYKKYKKRINIMSPLLIGEKPHNLTLMDSSNNWVPLYTLQAKYTVLMFWDPECGHCQKEIPVLVKYCQNLDKEDRSKIKIYTVSSRSGKEWKDFIKKNKMAFVNTAVPHEVFKDQAFTNQLVLTGKTDIKSLNYHDTFDIYSTPTIYLLGKDKTIIAKRMDVKVLKKILNNKLDIKKDKKG